MHVSWYWILGNLNVRVRHIEGDDQACVMVFHQGCMRLVFTSTEKLIVRMAYHAQNPIPYDNRCVERVLLDNVPAKIAKQMRQLARR